MKTLSVAAAALLTSISSAGAVTVWQGIAVLQAVTDQCLPFGVVAGHDYRAIFRPKGVDDNGDNDRLSLVGGRAVHALKVISAGGEFTGDGDYEGQGVGGTVSFIDMNAPTNGTFVDAAKTPAVVDLTTRTVVITGRINSLFAIAGCDVTFRGHVLKRP